MAVPKRRKTPSKRDKRRSQHDKVKPVNVSTCPKCGEVRLPHQVCPACGYYKERQVRPGREEASA